MGIIHKTARGANIDMNRLTMVHELTQAVGNIKVNARGDEIGYGGKIIRTKEEILAEQYAATGQPQRANIEQPVPQPSVKVESPVQQSVVIPEKPLQSIGQFVKVDDASKHKPKKETEEKSDA